MEKEKFTIDKNKKYIFATDLDGTFLSHYNVGMNISNFKAVKAVKESGNYFIIATGRSWWWTKMLYKQLELTTPSIHFSGAQIRSNNKDTSDIYRNSISKERAIEIIKEFNLSDKAVEIAAVGRKYTAHFTKVNNIEDLFFNPYELVLILEKTKATPEFLAELRSKVEPELTLRIWHNDSDNVKTIDAVISPAGTNKAIALEKLAKELGVDQENVVYFGDNVNDLEALEWAGQSYAPLNGTDVAKKAANEVLTDTNNNAAVARKILELLNE